MKLKTLLLLNVIFASHPMAQTVATNKISPTEALRTAAHLTVGMQHAEVRKVLERSGFGKVSGTVSRHSAFIQQDPLADGFALSLEYTPTLDLTNKWDLLIATSRLQGASILSNGVQIISITLTNAP